MPRQRQSSDAPRLGTDDTFAPQEAARAAKPRPDPNNIQDSVDAALSQMSAAGADAELNYQQALRGLASNPQAAVTAVVDRYRAADEDQYIERWTQVHLLADLRDSNAAAIFDTIVSTPIPPEQAPGMVTYSTVGEEVMIRTTAIEGLTRLAAQGDRQALDLLRKHTRHDAFSVKRAAIQGYIEAAGAGARDELRKTLPQEDHFILDLRRAEVQDVPQPRIESTSNETEAERPPSPRPSGRPRIEE